MQILLLILAAVLEVGGDAFIRHGLQKRGILAMILGATLLGVYGFMVNITKLDFGRMMGIYIVLFFAVSQLASVLIFKERLPWPVMIGGGFILVGGALMLIKSS